MVTARERFREVIENVWTVTENRILKDESIRYVTTLSIGVRPVRKDMAQYCRVALSGRSLSAIENHLTVMGFWRSHRRNNNKPKRRKARRRPVGQFASRVRVQSTSTRNPAGKIKIVRSFQCPGCGLHSEVI